MWEYSISSSIKLSHYKRNIYVQTYASVYWLVPPDRWKTELALTDVALIIEIVSGECWLRLESSTIQSLWPCDLDLWLFDLILIVWRGIVMDYPCAKFGDLSFSRFGFIVSDRQTDRQTESHTDVDDRYTHVTPVPSAWVKIKQIVDAYWVQVQSIMHDT